MPNNIAGRCETNTYDRINNYEFNLMSMNNISIVHPVDMCRFNPKYSIDDIKQSNYNR